MPRYSPDANPKADAQPNMSPGTPSPGIIRKKRAVEDDDGDIPVVSNDRYPFDGLGSRDSLLFLTCEHFFHDPVHGANRMQQFWNYKTKHQGLSLRILEYAVLHFARLRADATRNADGVILPIFTNYQQTLAHHGKKRFDPCCRGKRKGHFFITWTRHGDAPRTGGPNPHPAERIETALRQLNFFRWALEWGIIDYVHAHHQELRKCMAKHSGSPSSSLEIEPAVPAKRRYLEDGAKRARMWSDTDDLERFSSGIDMAKIKRRAIMPAAPSTQIHVVLDAYNPC